jgi:tRNA(Arg) A34 adenosine deaminase TadA
MPAGSLSALVFDSLVRIGVIAGLGGRPSIVACVLADRSGPEQACVESAWQALLAGTIPIGAVVADADGIIIRSAGMPYIGLPVSGSHPDCRLVTSLEPCQTCSGALRMATVGALAYLGADPVNGTSWLLESGRIHRRSGTRTSSPLPRTRRCAARAVR